MVVKYCNSSNKEHTTNRFMVSKQMKMIQLQHSIRTRLSLKETEGLFFFVGKNKLQTQEGLVGDIYLTNKDEFGILNITCRNIEKFG